MEVIYGTTLYNPTGLRKAARVYGGELATLMKRDPKIVGLVSTGSSGAILAAVLLMKKMPRPLKHIHVNKPDGGHSHDGSFSGFYADHTEGIYVFVDDFITSGASFRRCWDAFLELEDRGMKLRYALVNRGIFDKTDSFYEKVEVIHAK